MVDLTSVLNSKLNTTDTAVSVEKLETARAISITGNATDSASFNGSGDISIDTTVNQATTALNIPTSDVGGNIWIS